MWCVTAGDIGPAGAKGPPGPEGEAGGVNCTAAHISAGSWQQRRVYTDGVHCLLDLHRPRQHVWKACFPKLARLQQLPVDLMFPSRMPKQCLCQALS